MNDTEKRIIAQKFEETIDKLVNDDMQENQMLWENPLHAHLMITSAIGIASKNFKQMMLENKSMFRMSSMEVDVFIEKLADYVRSTYYD